MKSNTYMYVLYRYRYLMLSVMCSRTLLVLFIIGDG